MRNVQRLLFRAIRLVDTPFTKFPESHRSINLFQHVNCQVQIPEELDGFRACLPRAVLTNAVTEELRVCTPNPWGPGYTRAYSSKNKSDSDSVSENDTSPGIDFKPLEQPQTMHISLQDALTKLVDTAVDLVEKGDASGAISVLKEGIDTFEPQFQDSPELSELHNQVALLSLMQADADTAAHHAKVAYDMTLKAFGPDSLLVGHRSLRLGVACFAQNKVKEAASYLQPAHETLMVRNDPAQYEASLYLSFTLLAGISQAGQAAQLDGDILSSFKRVANTYGSESLVCSLAIAQHDRLVHSPLSAAEPDALLSETLLKQHAKVLELLNPESEDLALVRYKLGTFYYVQDMLHDAEAYIRQAADYLRKLYAEDSDLVLMCKHRLGMVCAAGRDHRAAMQLLQASHEHFAQGSGSGQGLAAEAETGLAMARYRALPLAASSTERETSLKQIRAAVDKLAASIGPNHMLSRGAMRHLAQMSIMASRT